MWQVRDYSLCLKNFSRNPCFWCSLAHITNPLFHSRWLDIDFILFFCMFMDLDSVDKHARKELDQYPAILTSRLVNNPYSYALPYLCKSLLSYKTDHVQAADQTEARTFVKTATYSWKPELVQKESSGWSGTSATFPRYLCEKPSVPVLWQEHMYKHYKDIRVLKSNVQRATRIELYILNGKAIKESGCYKQNKINYKLRKQL